MSRTQVDILAVFVVVVVAGLSLERLYAETCTAATLTPEAVWEAINAAKDGDTVQLPAGTADWPKGWNSLRGAKMKAITIQGAGMDKTVICDRRTRGYFVPFQLLGVEGKPFRVTGITFVGPDLTSAGPSGGFVSISGTCKNFRIDHCKFKNAQTMMSITGDTYGLIDHCWFDDEDWERSPAQPIWCSGPGAPNYRKPLTLGTAAALYLEDNEVHLGPGATKGGDVPWIAPNNGARVVIRHNNIVNSQIEIYGHGVQKGFYGCQQAEIYDNAFSAVGLKQGSPQGFIFINAGVAIVFNNTVTGTTYNCKTIQLTHERSFQDRGGFGVCDGKNPVDGNQIPAGQKGAGYPCMGQPGRGTDADGDGAVRTVTLLRLEQHAQWGEAEHGPAPLGSERDRTPGLARQGGAGFLQREAAGRILQALRLSPSTATRAVTREAQGARSCCDNYYGLRKRPAKRSLWPQYGGTSRQQLSPSTWADHR